MRWRDRAQGHHRGSHGSAMRHTAFTRPAMACSMPSDLQNPGVDHVVREILPSLDFTETRFIANVCGSTIEEYVEVTRRFDDSPIDAIEINISCPNVKEGGVQFGNLPEMSAPRRRSLSQRDQKTVDHQTVAESDRHSRERTPLHRCRHRCPRRDQHRDGYGDRSRHAPAHDSAMARAACPGRPSSPSPCSKSKRCTKSQAPRSIPIIGQGGITSARDALEFMIAGASAVGIGTALFYDPIVMPQRQSGNRRIPERPTVGWRSWSARSTCRHTELQ
jgi:dihydroorotate dehydrogenase (NAD+) catalytic subunit